MSKENILFAIIGVLLGVIVGYMFATSLNRQGQVRPAQAAGVTREVAPVGAELPENHPPISADGGPGTQANESGEDAALIERAQAAPNDYDAQMKAAEVHYRNRRFDEAIELLTRANQLRPESRETVVALGNANFDSGRYEAAEKWYTAALVKDPKDINVRTDLGLTFLVREPPDLNRAVQEFERSLKINPRHEQTLQNMAVALLKKGSYAEADAALRKLSEVNPSNPSLAQLRSELEAARGKTTQPAAR
ncbi:MAG TPA: tetratricopeptide repeat protein [Pyrinomonadaceae bacterium]|nr:tetratricopeptide repeat protein [Pyrinomonadaceae bacterium]